jgi:small subunit ribosomal protein S8
MSFTDPIGDMITRIRNAQMRLKKDVIVPASRLRKTVLEALLQEGYIKGIEEVGETPRERSFVVQLKYVKSRPVIREIRRVSKPSVHFYRKARENKPVANGLGSLILSTSAGVLSDSKARALGIGGKVLLYVS